jgi:hypothetical protein
MFGIGLAVLVGAGASTVGVTWASLHGAGPSKPVADTSPIASTVPGICTLLVAERAHTMDVDRARTLTMIAGVGTQVGAIPQEAARAVDIAMSNPAKYLPSVNDALTLLAGDDTATPSATSLAEVEALSRPAAMSCLFDPEAVPVEKKGADGLTPRAETVKSSVLDAFGKLQMTSAGRTAPSGDAAQAAGIGLTVSLAPIDDTKRATGWVLANWLVAHGSAYRLDRVSFDDHRWQPSDGWRVNPPLPTAGGSATTAGGPPAQAAAAATGQSDAARDLDRLRVVVAKGN